MRACMSVYVSVLGGGELGRELLDIRVIIPADSNSVAPSPCSAGVERYIGPGYALQNK